MIVDHDHLEGLEGLRSKGRQQVGKRSLFVTGRDQHGNLRLALQPVCGEP